MNTNRYHREVPPAGTFTPTGDGGMIVDCDLLEAHARKVRCAFTTVFETDMPTLETMDTDREVMQHIVAKVYHYEYHWFDENNVCARCGARWEDEQIDWHQNGVRNIGPRPDPLSEDQLL